MSRKKSRDPRLRLEIIRRSHAVSPFGVGSIVDLPNESVMPLAIDFWGGNFGIPIYDGRLEKRLGVTEFRMIPSHTESRNDGVPSVYFPRWMFCPSCRRFRPVEKWKADYDRIYSKPFSIPLCNTCRHRLVPARFIVACEHGHIDDFPWVEWAHSRRGVCATPELKISTGGTTGSLRGIRITCDSCDDWRTMEDSFSEGIHPRCTGNMPWLRTSEPCSLKPRTLQRGASNAYFPLVIGSIVIPTQSRGLEQALKSSKWWPILADESMGVSSVRDVAIQQLAQELERKEEEVSFVLSQMLDPEPAGDQVSEVSYRHQEYDMFVRGDLSSGDLRLESISADKYDLANIKSVTLVHRMREVRALVAFSRLRPLDKHVVPDEDSTTGSTRAVFVRGRKKNGHWLPAVEVRGEGFFLRFDQDALRDWAATDRVASRAQLLHERYNAMVGERGLAPREISPQFIFLHTFAHLLIRQLTFDAGYGSASLRERIYSNDVSGAPTMSGILIYTASGDSDGTLGGLVRLGKPSSLEQTIENMARTAYWCSSDPLCAESMGQGLDSLNLAACYACTLLPETGCEESNRLLDRALVVGPPDDPDLGFLTRVLQ